MVPVLLLLSLAADDAAAPACRAERLDEVRVLVLELASDPAQATQAKTLGTVIASEAARVPGHRVMTHDDLRAVVDQEAERQLMGCSDSECMSEFADALDTDLLVSGRLDATNPAAPVLALSLVNTRALVTINRVSLTWAGPSERMPDVARAAAMLLLREKRDRPPGGVALDGAPDDVRIYVDNEDVTARASDGAVRDLEIGPHTVRLEADGYEPSEHVVLVMSGETVRIDGALEARPLYTNLWLWSGVGAAVLATAVGTAAVFVMTRDSTVSATASMGPVGLGNVEAVKP